MGRALKAPMSQPFIEYQIGPCQTYITISYLSVITFTGEGCVDVKMAKVKSSIEGLKTN